MSVVTMRKIELPVEGIDLLRAEASAEGYAFLDTLVEEWASGINRFDAAGETLLAGFEDDVLIAVGGLNCDPFLGDPAVGRIRRVYVRQAWRSHGVGAALVTALLQHAHKHFSAVRLRAENPPAARLYERMGFVTIDDPHATHLLRFPAAPGTTAASPA